MAKTKAGRIYRRIKSQSFQRRKYMGGIPGSRIVQFDAGDKTTKFPVVVDLIAEERVQILHNCLEATRIAANRVMVKGCGAMGYHMRVRTYPHEVIRENKQASGAGADRVSQGMRASFGRNIATAARVEAGQAVLTFSIRPEHFLVVKEACRKANMKLPTPTRLEIKQGRDLVEALLARGAKAVAAAAKAITPAPAKEEPAEEEPEADAAEGEGDDDKK